MLFIAPVYHAKALSLLALTPHSGLRITDRFLSDLIELDIHRYRISDEYLFSL